jgi:hypothetical protein
LVEHRHTARFLSTTMTIIGITSSTLIEAVCLLVIYYLQLNESQLLSPSLCRVVTSDVFSLCATNAPSHVTSLVDIVDVGLPDEIPDAVRCGYRCSVMRQTDRCSAFSVVDGGTSGKTCQFYDNTTDLCFAASLNCVFLPGKNETCIRIQVGTYDVAANGIFRQLRYDAMKSTVAILS